LRRRDDMEKKRVQRITVQSKANVQVAEKIGIIKSDKGDGWLIWLERGGNKAFVCGVEGPIIYKDMATARRFIRRFRPDLAYSPTI
jgi:hypothetical protein